MREISSVDKFINNRVINRRKQFNYWRKNWRSGVLRFAERLLIGANISDKLGGDLRKFTYDSKLFAQVRSIDKISPAEILKELEIKPINSDLRIHLEGISQARSVLTLSEAKVDLSTGLVVLDSGFIVDAAIGQWQRFLHQGGLGDSYARLRGKTRYIKGAWSVLPKSDFYFHTIAEDLVSVLVLAETGRDFGVLVDASAARWTFEILDELNIPYMKSGDPALRVEELLCVTGSNSITKTDIIHARKRVGKRSEAGKPRILLVREGISRGDADLESQIFSSASKYGFIKVNPSDYSLHDQIDLFASAQVIIGCHGGALTNIIWSEPGLKVLEIFNHPYRSYDFARIANEAGHQYFAIESGEEPGIEKYVEDFCKKLG